MPPSAMPMTGHMMEGAPAALSADADPAYWGRQDFHSSDSTSSLSPSQGLYLSPTTSITTQSSINGSTPPVQTPQLDGAKRNSTSSQKNSQKQSNTETRASVAVACVPCRSRHLKCDGGVRCSRCRADNVDCTYIKSRRGWKGKRKNKEDSAPANLHGGSSPLSRLPSSNLISTTWSRSIRP
jgi:hypothetical protein